MESNSERTPEEVYRGFRWRYLSWLVIVLPLYIYADVLRAQGGIDLFGITLWTSIATVAVFAGAWVLYSLFATRFVNQVKAQNPNAVVFVARRTNFFDAGLDQITENKGFNLSYLSAIVVDADHLTIVSRRGGKVSIAWSRVEEVRAGVTRDFGDDYPCLTVVVRAAPEVVSLPMAASVNPWFVFTVTRPSVIRNLVTVVTNFERNRHPLGNVAPAE